MRRHLIGGISIKRLFLPLAAALLIFAFSACAAEQKNTGAYSGNGTVIDDTAGAETKAAEDAEGDASGAEEKKGDASDAEPDAAESGQEGADGNVVPAGLSDKKTELLQSASVDLDGDGKNEEVEVVRVLTDPADPGESGEQEGRLVIKNSAVQRQITFWKKEDGLTGLLSDMKFKDLDRDGSEDIFLIIPGSGAAFSYSNFFIYSYKKDQGFTFTSDSELTDFIEGFEPAYTKGGNKLSIVNRKYGFSADLTIGGNGDGGSAPTEETMPDYVKSMWIEPVSVDIGEDSKLALVTGAAGVPEIKVPLPIFGLATVDMIGEIDLYYAVDSGFRPVLKRFEILDFNGNEKVKAGECDLK